MLGRVDNENIRTRMLLKVLAVSDIVIYRFITFIQVIASYKYSQVDKLQDTC